jgi:hypothetical protein
MNDLLRRVESTPSPIETKYAIFNFTQNPFPTKPSVTIGSPDIRENGSIYLSDLRRKEQAKFEEMLIPNPDRPQVRTIAFLMDYATRRGRGIGKTAFLFHQLNRINDDLGKTLSRNSEVMFALYILPTPDGKTRKFYQFHRKLCQELNSQEIISKAMWRLRAFSGVIPEGVLEEIGSEPQKTIGNNGWLQSKGINVTWDLDRDIQSKLNKLGLNKGLAENLTRFGHDKDEFEKFFIDNLSDRAWNDDNGKIFFDDLVKFLKLAGFTKGLILVDEVEKIITPQNSQERRSFAEALRFFFVDGQCENARLSFYSLLLTIHPYIQELLNPHWKAAGLDRFAALSAQLDSEYTIYFEPLNKELAIPLAIAYLDASRLSPEFKGRLEPFEPGALEEALVLSGRVPGIYLSLLNNVIEKAIQEARTTINAELIKRVFQIRTPKEPSAEDLTGPLPPAQVNLLEDESK